MQDYVNYLKVWTLQHGKVVALGTNQIMDAPLKRRISVASCWASTRAAVLDAHERYEDSYAITQEFREWITCGGEHPEHLKASVLKVPTFHQKTTFEELSDPDEVLEI